MTDPTTPRPLPAEKPVGFWSFVTTDESIARGQVNFWAILETVVAIAAFWWVALTFETWVIFYPSLIAAPLLLLRSEESVKQGVRWVENGFLGWPTPEDRSERLAAMEKFERQITRISGFVGIIGGTVAAYALSNACHASLEGWPAFMRGIEIGPISVFGAAAITAAVAGGAGGAAAGGHAVATVLASVSAGIKAVVVAATIAGAAAGVAAIIGFTAASGSTENVAMGAGIAAAAIVLIGASIEILAGSAPTTGTSIVLFTVLPVTFSFFGSVALGVFTATLIFRVAATVYYFSQGYAAIPTNLSRVCLSTSPLHPPELIPGLPTNHHLRLQSVSRHVLTGINQGHTSQKILAVVGLVFILVWFLPGMLYRFTLKSTMWLWWILWFVAGTPHLDRGIRGLKVDHVDKLKAKLSICLAVLALVAFAVPNILFPWLGYEAIHPPIPPMVALFAVVDWGNFALQPLIAAATAVLTLGIVFWIDSVEKDDSIGRDTSSGLSRIGHAAKWKTALGWATIVLTMLYVALFVNTQHGWLPVSDFAQHPLEWVYGKYAEALRPMKP